MKASAASETTPDSPSRSSGTVAFSYDYYPRGITRSSLSTSQLLSQIPVNVPIESIAFQKNFDSYLGTNTSPTSQLWNLLVNELRNHHQPSRQGIQVVASKLIAGKRPLLVPITDSYVRAQLNLTWPNSWYNYWMIMKDPVIQKSLISIRSQAALALSNVNTSPIKAKDVSQLSLARVLDIVAWYHFRNNRH